MKSLCFIACLLCLALVADVTNARKDQGAYWKDVSKKNGEIEPTHVPIVDGLKPTTHKSLVRDFKPRPNVAIIYGDNGNIKSIDEKSVVRDFKPRPNIAIIYGDNGNMKSIDEKSVVRDFEPRPNIAIIYGEDGNVKSKDEKSVVRADVDNKKSGTNDVNV